MHNFTFTFAFFFLFSLNAMAQQGHSYGKEITEANALLPAELITEMDGKIEQEVKFTAKVNEVCQVKGCWMTLDLENGDEVRVRFKDYGFFVPKDAGGKTAVVEGRAYVDSVSVATLRHYAEDAGKSKEEIKSITKPEVRLSFIADGVILKD